MYLRTGESFVTEEVLSMPYTASSSGYLSNHVKVPSSQFLTACCGRFTGRTSPCFSPLFATRDRALFRTAYCAGVRAQASRG